MKVAVVGTGISGMLSAWLLHRRGVDVTVFEQEHRVGGHTNTVEVATNAGPVPVDTGFIVFNHDNYPQFSRLLEILGVEHQPSTMSFSVHDEADGLEWNGSGLGRFFGQRRNLLRPSMWRMLFEFLRFGRDAERLLASPETAPEQGLGAWLAANGYSNAFRERFAIPMGAAIWSASVPQMADFPIRPYLRFFHNHGMLRLRGRPQWRTITGGSRRYRDALTASYADRITTGDAVAAISRRPDHVRIVTEAGHEGRFDQVVVACHAPDALRLVIEPTPAEAEVLAAFPYQRNQAVLHSDPSYMPRRRRCWAAWNYRRPDGECEALSVTYWMNALQSLDTEQPLFVTLNPHRPIARELVHHRVTYHHPTFTAAGFAAQSRHSLVSGSDRIHYCGAYWGWGFHEDGVRSALAVARCFGIEGLDDVPARSMA